MSDEKDIEKISTITYIDGSIETFNEVVWNIIKGRDAIHMHTMRSEDREYKYIPFTSIMKIETKTKTFWDKRYDEDN